MKPDIHPTYYPESTVTCAACGTTWKTGSTQEEIKTEICSNCHPFYTGVEKIVDTAGRVEKFKARKEAASKAPKKEKKTKERKSSEK